MTKKPYHTQKVRKERNASVLSTAVIIAFIAVLILLLLGLVKYIQYQKTSSSDAKGIPSPEDIPAISDQLQHPKASNGSEHTPDELLYETE